MTTLIVYLAVVSAPVDQTHQADASQAEPRRYHEIHSDMSGALRREAQAKTFADRARAVKDLCDVYVELKRDPRLAESETLQQYKLKTRSRLVRVKKDIERKLKRNRGRTSQSRRSSRIVRGSQRRNTSANATAAHKQSSGANEVAKTLAVHLDLFGSTMGGPGQVTSDSGRAFGGGGVPDNGDSLVDLIQSVIAPDFWDINGGPGVIIYYRPLHVLVVRATAEVHGKVGGVIGGVRKAGK